MSLRQVVAVPFQQGGTERLSEQEFVVALSLHRDWFSPAQAKRAVTLAAEAGLVDREGDELVSAFDIQAVSVPTGFEPDEDVLNRRPTFEVMLERLVEGGCEKHAAVSEINRLQHEHGVTIEAAAALFGAQRGIELDGEIARAKAELIEEDSP